jgi:hypothetical protein
MQAQDAAPRVFHYREDTREFCGSEVADLSPLEPGALLVPRLATAKAPPDVPAGFVAVFDPDSDQWAVRLDARGVYFGSDGAVLTVREIGVEAPANASKTQRPSNDHVLVDGAWQIDAERVKFRLKAAIQATLSHRRASGAALHIDGAEVVLQTDLVAISRYLMASVLDRGPALDWLLPDGRQIALTPAKARAILQVVAARDSALTAAAANHYAAIESGADLGRYNTSEGWP